MLNSAVVKQQVNASYSLYVVAAATQNGEQKPMCRLSFHKLTCLEMIEQANEETIEMVRRQMKNDALDMPD